MIIPQIVNASWMAITLETSANLAVLLGVNNGIAANFGSTLAIGFNLSTGAMFTSTYNYSLKSVNSGIACSAGASIQLGLLTGVFNINEDTYSVARSMSGPFNVNSGSMCNIVGSIITSQQWNGPALGIGPSFGLPIGATNEITNYTDPIYFKRPIQA